MGEVLSGDDQEATRIVGVAAGPPAARVRGTRGAARGDLLPLGCRVAEFEIARVVGQGGFGVVYEAWDHTLERWVALKEYLPTALSMRRADGWVVPLSDRHRETFALGMRSFVNEARLLAQFDHPSLIKVYRFWRERGTTYMVMPFLRGETLDRVLAARVGGVGEDWLLDVMDGVTQALGVMHAAHCYHRDIAPDNILLLAESCRPMGLDFGAARRALGDEAQAASVILKPGYAPIEQYAELPGATQGPWTDVYALAAVLHVAVRGRAPPPSTTRLLSDACAPLAGDEMLRRRYSPRLLAAIDAGLAVRPEARPRSMDELRAALGLPAFVVPVDGIRCPAPGPGSPVVGPTSLASAPAAARPRGRRWRRLALSLCGVALWAGVGGWVWPGRSAPPRPSPPPPPPALVDGPARAHGGAAVPSVPSGPSAPSARSGPSGRPPVPAPRWHRRLHERRAVKHGPASRRRPSISVPSKGHRHVG